MPVVQENKVNTVEPVREGGFIILRGESYKITGKLLQLTSDDPSHL
jgi:hypothetical protein